MRFNELIRVPYQLAAGFLALAFLVGCSGQSWDTLDITGVMPDLKFDLVHESKGAVDETDFSGDDKVTLLYFGFTHCPDVCPLTMSRLASLIRQLPDDMQDDVQVLFVSVDPQRDTTEYLSQYTSVFGPQFEGLTGDQSALDALTRRYRVTYSYGEPDEHGQYDVSHSSAIFAFSADHKARLVIRDSDSDEGVLSDLRQLIALN